MNSYFLHYESSGSGKSISRVDSDVVKWKRIETNTGLDIAVGMLREFKCYDVYVGKELSASIRRGVIKIGDVVVKGGVVRGLRPSWENLGKDGNIEFKQTGILPKGELIIGADCVGMVSSHGGILDFLIGLVFPSRRVKCEPHLKLSFDKDRVCEVLALCILLYFSDDNTGSVPD